MPCYSVQLTTNPNFQRFFNLDFTSGKVSVGGDGNKQITFTSRPDIARYVSYVLTHLPAEQLKNRGFSIAGDSKVMSNFFGNSHIARWECPTNDKPLISHSMKYSRHMKKRLGRSWRSLTFPFPNSMPN
jgi:hypothetical protein